VRRTRLRLLTVFLSLLALVLIGVLLGIIRLK